MDNTSTIEMTELRRVHLLLKAAAYLLFVMSVYRTTARRAKEKDGLEWSYLADSFQ